MRRSSYGTPSVWVVMRLREGEEAVVRRVVDSLLELARRGVITLKHVDTERGLLIIMYRGCEFTIKLYLVYYPETPGEWVRALERAFELDCGKG